MRYHYQSSFSRGNYFGPRLFTDAIKLLVSINFLVFLLQTISGQERILFQLFGMVPKNTWSQLMIWQPFTYLFFHGGIWHVLINMFVLWMFGSELETVWGKKEFLKYYFITGIGSGLVTIFFSLNSLIPVVGASGAVYGILLAYGLTFPNRYVYLYFLIPVKVKFFVIVIGGIAFFSSIGAGSSGVSHLTHLSGMLIGLGYLKSNYKLDMVKNILVKQKDEIRHRIIKNKRRRDEDLRFEVDQLLDRINEVGYDGLSDKQKKFLYEASKKLGKGEYRN
ncbi:MAG: rhomboid family intramembrane serine protease [Candidatus Neomarinimicrobiota bacterium]